jgi:hypothetical protein
MADLVQLHYMYPIFIFYTKEMDFERYFFNDLAFYFTKQRKKIAADDRGNNNT